MDWSEIVVERSEWNLPADRAKDRKPHLIQLPTQILAMILAQQPDPKLRRGPVFTLNGAKSPSMGTQLAERLHANLHRRLEYANAAEDLDNTVDHFTVHDIRKVPVSTLVEDPFNAPKDLIDAILLHSGGKTMANRYALSQLDRETGAMMQCWNDHVDEIMAEADAFPGGRELPHLNAE